MNFNIADLPAVREQLERDAAELAAAHAAQAVGSEPGVTLMKATRSPNPSNPEAASNAASDSARMYVRAPAASGERSAAGRPPAVQRNTR